MGELPYGARVGMVPVEIRLAMRAAGESGTDRVVAFDPNAGEYADDLVRASFAFDGEVAEVAITPVVPLIADEFALEFRHAFVTEEQVLLNGYQSWTDTVERSPWSHMRGLRIVPRILVDRFVLDGGGDYRFHSYRIARGRQHGYTYATFRREEGMVLVGSLDEGEGFTKISIEASDGRVILSTECPLTVLPAGEAYVLGRYAITRGVLEECYDRYFELAEIKARTMCKLVGYGSWYRHYDAIDEAKLAADLAGEAAALPPLLDAASKDVAEFAGGIAPEQPISLFQIDDGYCKVGDWLKVDTEKFPYGVAPLAYAARKAGFLPGLWIAPFLCERGSRIFTEHDDWLLRDEAGNLVTTGSHWSGGIALDTRNTEVRTYVLEVLQTMVEEWGFGLIKADFLYAACMVPHDGMNRGQLMADAIDLLRAGVGDACLILGCGVPLASAFGKLDYCRIGCDVSLDWDGPPYMRGMHRERVSTKASLGNTYGRAPLDGRAFGNDPDVFFLRRDVKHSPDQRDALLFADADLGSVFLTSDDMAAWDTEQRSRFLEALKLFLEQRDSPLCSK